MTVARNPTIAPFPTDPVLTGIVIAYRNGKLIADRVMPRVTVGKKEYKYFKYAKGDRFTLPDTRVGRRSKPNTTEFGATEDVGMCVWNALDAHIPNADIDGAPPGHSPVNQHVMTNTELIALGREKRTADMIFNAANYPAANKTTVAGTDRWFHADSDPIGQIEAAKDALIMSGNTLVLGRKTWRHLKTNRAVVSAVNRNDGTKGVARLQDVADLLELDEILVGEGWVNTAKPGQAPNLVRVWGNHASLHHINRNANAEGGITFGFTAQYGGPLAGQWPDKNIGAEGGICARSGECVEEKIVASDLGYFFQNAGDST